MCNWITVEPSRIQLTDIAKQNREGAVVVIYWFSQARVWTTK